MDTRNQGYEGDPRYAYAVHIKNNTIRKESQSPIYEVLARSCWRAGPGQKASDGSKVMREGKVGPFIPCEVRAQTGPARATMPAVVHGCCRVTTAIGARATTSAPGQQRMRSGDNACAHARTSAPVRRRVPRGRGVFSQTPQTLALGQQRLRPGDDVYRLHS